jgi:hypothetical protein
MADSEVIRVGSAFLAKKLDDPKMNCRSDGWGLTRVGCQAWSNVRITGATGSIWNGRRIRNGLEMQRGYKHEGQAGFVLETKQPRCHDAGNRATPAANKITARDLFYAPGRKLVRAGGISFRLGTNQAQHQ